MELILRKDQAKKMIGGVSFELMAKVKLDEEESMLVDRYKAHKMVLHQRYGSVTKFAKSAGGITGKIAGSIAEKVLDNITIGGLVNGVNFKCKNIEEILEHEDLLKGACETFYIYLDTMKNFGGEERISYPEALEEATA